MACEQGVQIEMIVDTLDSLSVKHRCAKGSAWHNYMVEYERHLGHFRDMPILFLEIGVWHGESIRMWKEYFPNAVIVGIDCIEDCKQYEDERVKIFIGRQEDTKFLADVIREIGMPQVIIDDGGHLLVEQHATMYFLMPQMTSKSWYFIEDVPEIGMAPLRSIYEDIAKRFGGFELVNVYEGAKHESLFAIRRS